MRARIGLLAIVLAAAATGCQCCDVCEEDDSFASYTREAAPPPGERPVRFGEATAEPPLAKSGTAAAGAYGGTDGR